MAGIAIIGASERTIWTEWLLHGLTHYGYADPVWMVNPGRTEVFGRPSYPAVAELPERPDAAIVAVGAHDAVRECERLLELGVGEVCLIANGFRETGLPERIELEARLRDVCAGSDARVIGPNCVGFARFHDGLCALAQPVPHGVVPGDVSVVSQSGGLSNAVLGALQREGLGVDLCYSIGNGTVFGVEDSLEWALSRQTTRTVCAVLESISDADRIGAAVEAGCAEGKEVVAVVLGRSARGREAARSHTGAVIGEQRILIARLERLGVLVADSIPEQARIASLAASIGRQDARRGVMVITASGGGATLTADAAERHGVPLASLRADTVETLGALVPPGPFVGNPLDATAANGPGAVPEVYEAAAADPGVGLLVEPYVLPWPDESERHRWHREALERIADCAARGGVGTLVVSLYEQEPNAWTRELARRPGVSVGCGLDETMRALARLYGGTPAPTERDGGAGRPVLGEAEGRRVLEAAGVPITRGGLASDEDAAAEVAATLRPPFVVKLGVEGIGHKGRLGGVELGVVDADAVRAACLAIAARAREHDTDASAFLVAEMAFGPELLVGAIRDPVAGPSLTVAVGGWAAESGATFGTVALPADLAASVVEWGLPRLVGDARSAALAGFLDVVAASFTDGALAAYTEVELNPVILAADGVVAADVLLVP